MNKQLKKCSFCPRPVTNQQHLVFVEETGSNYYACNLCYYQGQIARNHKTITWLTNRNQEFQKKLTEISKKTNHYD